MQKPPEINKLLESREFTAWSGSKFICLRDQEDCLRTYQEGNNST